MAAKKRAAKQEGQPAGESKQAKMLAAAVRKAGSEDKMAETLECSQQSVSAWLRGTNVPRAAMQVKLFELLKIPQPWPKVGG